jgi:hypothetical protein
VAAWAVIGIARRDAAAAAMMNFVGLMAGWAVAYMLIKLLTGVFDPPLKHWLSHGFFWLS